MLDLRVWHVGQGALFSGFHRPNDLHTRLISMPGDILSRGVNLRPPCRLGNGSRSHARAAGKHVAPAEHLHSWKNWPEEFQCPQARGRGWDPTNEHGKLI